ncbi:hypothetical protein M3Y99_00294500 [Aphelenchoides fujianensis]|nr:hypothetical protein M3Y99_00294500 [Aphelenchoides fujianensis]
MANADETKAYELPATASWVYQVRPSTKELVEERQQAAATPSSITLPTKLKVPYSQFLYEDMRKLKLSPDGRYAYFFRCWPEGLVVVDLLRNVRSAFHPTGAPLRLPKDFLIVNPTTIVVLDHARVLLLRLSVEENTYDAVVLQHRTLPLLPAYVFTEISGTNVELKRATAERAPTSRVHFVRLNVDAARLQVGREERTDRPLVHRLSEDGRSLYAIDLDRPTILCVFDLEQQTWSSSKLKGDIDGTPSWRDGRLAWGDECVYFWGRFDSDQFSVFRCNLERLQWENLPFTMDPSDRLLPLVNAETGGEDGLLIVRCDEEQKNVEIYRLLLNTPDSLLRLCVDVLRKTRIDGDGELGFHAVMTSECGRKILPTIYSNMTPIPRHLN